MTDQSNNGVVMNRMARAICELPSDVRVDHRRSTAIADAVDHRALAHQSFLGIVLEGPQNVASRDARISNFTLKPGISVARIVVYFSALQSPRETLKVLDNVAVVLTDRGAELGAGDL